MPKVKGGWQKVQEKKLKDSADSRGKRTLFDVGITRQQLPNIDHNIPNTEPPCTTSGTHKPHVNVLAVSNSSSSNSTNTISSPDCHQPIQIQPVDQPQQNK